MADGTRKILAVRIGFGSAMILGLAGIFLIDLVTGENFATTLLAVAVTGLGVWEVCGLCERKGLRPWRFTASVAAGLLVVAHWLDLRLSAPGALPFTVAVLLGLFVVLALQGLMRRSLTTVLEDTGVTLFALFYVWFLLAFPFQMRNHPGLPGDTGLWVTFMLVVASKAGDVGAFFTGTFLGRHRLAPSLSPNKTLEGALGGLAASVGAALLFRALVPECRALFAPGPAVLFGVVVGVLSAVGDLFESMLKRSVHAKDSGALVPQFGGILDLLDGLLFSGPAAYFLVLVWMR